MNPIAMATVIISLVALFAWSANRRWQLLKVGRPESRIDSVRERIEGVLVYAFRQKKMYYYPLAGLAHQLIFAGFLILLARSMILWGRGFDPSFNLWILGPDPVFGLPLGHLYEFLKDLIALAVVAGAGTFLYFRKVKHVERMTQSGEAILILGIIITMMVADMVYDGASIALHHRFAQSACTDDADTCGRVTTLLAQFGAEPVSAQLAFSPMTPAGSVFALALSWAGTGLLVAIAHVGFWTHSTLVLVFLNILPHSKHFHIITAIPNVFARSLAPKGRLPFMGSMEQIGEKVMAAAEEPEKAAPVGISRIEHFTWKAVLDFYTCTECGRCSDNCPAHRTGKILSPKMITLDLRDHLYGREHELLNRPGGPKGPDPDDHAHAAHAEGDHAHGDDSAHAEGHDHGHDDHGHHAPVLPENPVPYPDVKSEPVELVGNVIHPDVLWACTTCRACEEQCPVMISYVDKIVEMRRHLVLVKGEFPAMLGGPFQAMEVNGNPWNLARMDRANWADGLDVPMMADHPKAEVLDWVGCAASYDDRAKKIARATAKLLRQAKVDFAILGQEETCTGDAARRAGNEYLFAQLAEQNVGTINGYKEQGGVKTILTTCPHCFNTLKNEYPDFGGTWDVVHHTDYLLGLVAAKRLVPTKAVKGRVVYHDSCYLGRYNEVYESPREILRAIPGVELVEPEQSKSTGLCCGAGGAQMWMEEGNKDRVNVRRTLQLLKTDPKTIATACPFCQTMITDGLKAESKEESVRQLDIVELLAESCVVEQPKKADSDDAEKAAPAEAVAAE